MWRFSGFVDISIYSHLFFFFFLFFFPDDGGSRGGQKPADGREGPSGRRRGVFFNLTSPHGSGQDYQGCSMGSGGG